jgi:hypothetical protein
MAAGVADMAAERETLNPAGRVAMKMARSAITTATPITILTNIVLLFVYGYELIELWVTTLFDAMRFLVLRDDNHPRHAEAVGDHAESRREKRFTKWHVDIATIA